MHNCTTIIGAADLSSGADSQTNTIIAEEGSFCTTVTAQIEVDVGSVLVGTSESVLRAERVPIYRAEVVDHDDD